MVQSPPDKRKPGYLLIEKRPGFLKIIYSKRTAVPLAVTINMLPFTVS